MIFIVNITTIVVIIIVIAVTVIIITIIIYYLLLLVLLLSFTYFIYCRRNRKWQSPKLLQFLYFMFNSVSFVYLVIFVFMLWYCILSFASRLANCTQTLIREVLISYIPLLTHVY